MKKKQLKLAKLEIDSFTTSTPTNTHTIKGGSVRCTTSQTINTPPLTTVSPYTVIGCAVSPGITLDCTGTTSSTPPPFSNRPAEICR